MFNPSKIRFFSELGIPIHFPRTSGRINPGIVLGDLFLTFSVRGYYDDYGHCF